MRLVPLALLALVALPLAGCAGVTERLGSSGDAAAEAPAPYYREHRESVALREARTYALPVEPGARLLNVTVSLESQDAGLGLPPAAPAALDVEVRDPSGATRVYARLDAAHPTRSLLVEPPEMVGEYVVRVGGVGASQDVEGARVGAGYLLRLEVVYG